GTEGIMRIFKEPGNGVRLTALISVLLIGAASFAAGDLENKPIKIAAILPTSGPNAAQGMGMMNSCEAAIRDANTSTPPGHQRFELMNLDDASDPDVAIHAAEKAAKDPQVLAVTAHWNSGPAIATVPIFHRNGLANLVPAAINSRITLEQPG